MEFLQRYHCPDLHKPDHTHIHKHYIHIFSKKPPIELLLYICFYLKLIDTSDLRLSFVHHAPAATAAETPLLKSVGTVTIRAASSLSYR